MHWKNAADPELRRLAEYNVLLCYRDEDPYDDRCDALNLCFGSTGVEIRLGVFDDEARTAYMHGVCILMAWALAQRLELDNPHYLVITVDEKYGWSGHVALLLDEHTVLDFEGKRTVEEVLAEYPVRLKHEVLTEEQVMGRRVEEPYRNNPMTFLDTLEQKVTWDFAERILKRDNLA